MKLQKIANHWTRSKLRLVGGLTLALFAAGCHEPPTPSQPHGSPTPETTADSGSGARVGLQAIDVADQRPGTTLTIAMVALGAPGFVAIHTDDNGSPGRILAVSVLLPAGDSPNATVTLPQATTDGTRLHAMPHRDDGDGVFDAAKDPPLNDTIGSTISTTFMVDASAMDAPAVQF